MLHYGYHHHHHHQSGHNANLFRCSYEDCTFVGSSNAVEIHRMDRHLIYPPGWDFRKNKSDWDADPSLKGKTILIQGTNVALDTPDVLEAWIAERKRRWPTSSRVNDKKREREEAVARGQVYVDSFKRPRMDDDRRGRGIGRTRGGWGASSRGATAAAIPRGNRETTTPSSGSDDELPEVVSSKTTVPLPARPPPPLVVKKITKQPKNPPRNPFASRPPLLRNLLLPEIKITVSNLSQAIRFLVDNDFLDGVEMKPGDEERRNIVEIN